MKPIQYILIASLSLAIALASFDASAKKKRGKPLKNTKTAVILVSVDDTGMPFVDYDEMEINAGDRLIFVGPEDFEIEFPKKSPFKVKKMMTQEGVINVKVKKKAKLKGKTLTYKYDIIYNDKRLDPDIIIKH